MDEKLSKKERNRRLKLGITTLVIVCVAYFTAKITKDTSGDWLKLALITAGTFAFIGGYLTLTDIFGKIR